jgi:hypothetical protein
MKTPAASARRWKEARGSRAPRALRNDRPGARLGIRRTVTTAAVVLIAGSSTVLACPVCFGAEETSLIDGTRLGVLVLLAITLAVQGGFLAFFLHLRKRAKKFADVELDTEWSKLQRSPRIS